MNSVKLKEILDIVQFCEENCCSDTISIFCKKNKKELDLFVGFCDDGSGDIECHLQDGIPSRPRLFSGACFSFLA